MREREIRSRAPFASTRGRVVRTLGETIVASLPAGCVGDGVVVESNGRRIAGVVAAVDRRHVTISALADLRGVAAGDVVRGDDDARRCVLGFGALGRAVDACGAPLDGGPVLRGSRRAIDPVPPRPDERAPIERAAYTGVPVLDALLTLGRGARVGLFGAPSCGKSTLLETIARRASADAIVVALIGERGREAERWIERRDARTTIVCATSDRAAAERVRAAETAMAQSCVLRDRGAHVLLIVDSLARYANAERERRSSLGEAVGRGGYPAAVWAVLARYLECAGAARDGSITLVATVLSDGGDEREPLSDNARSLLDGHIVLSNSLARAGRYPAVDVLASASRTMDAVVSREHRAAARTVRAALARIAATEDARALGLIAHADPVLEAALLAEPDLEALVRSQAMDPKRAIDELLGIARRLVAAE
jgi:type III secretion protein N (ATPase)